MTATAHAVRLLIIGGGFSGIGMAIRLRQSGIDDFVILERAATAGGTWRDNSYPGCACDVQSSLYSFSFAPNPDWSRSYSAQPEIERYLLRLVEQYDLARHFVYSQNVTAAAWNEHEQRWSVTSTSREWSAEFVVMAAGPLSDPVIPEIPGIDHFRGHRFHSARWNHDIDLTGTRTAVIGTGASAIQFVPRIQPRVAQLTLFQRTAPWVLPRWDRAVPGWRQRLYRRLPITQRTARAGLFALREALLLPFRHPSFGGVVEWAATRHMHAQVTDASLRAVLVPDYRIGCKRILVSDDYYPAIAQPNVSLVTAPITQVTSDGVQTSDGRHHPADVLIFGTGFRPTDPPLAPYIRGRDGVTLAQAWQGSPRAYMSTTAAGFPNLGILLGPNSAIGHTSILMIVEAQIEHLLSLLGTMVARRAGAIEPRAEAQQAYVSWVDRRLSTTVWNRGQCRSWYLDRTGRNSALWPDGIAAFRRRVSTPIMADYLVTPRMHADRKAQA